MGGLGFIERVTHGSWQDEEKQMKHTGIIQTTYCTISACANAYCCVVIVLPAPALLHRQTQGILHYSMDIFFL